MRGVTSQLGGVRTLVNRVRRLQARVAPRTHYIWLDYQDEPIGPKRDALIASGVAQPTDNFTAFSWKTPQHDPPSAPPAANAVDIQS